MLVPKVTDFTWRPPLEYVTAGGKYSVALMWCVVQMIDCDIPWEIKQSNVTTLTFILAEYPSRFSLLLFCFLMLPFLFSYEINASLNVLFGFAILYCVCVCLIVRLPGDYLSGYTCSQWQFLYKRDWLIYRSSCSQQTSNAITTTTAIANYTYHPAQTVKKHGCEVDTCSALSSTRRNITHNTPVDIRLS